MFFCFKFFHQSFTCSKDLSLLQLYFLLTHWSVQGCLKYQANIYSWITPDPAIHVVWRLVTLLYHCQWNYIQVWEYPRLIRKGLKWVLWARMVPFTSEIGTMTSVVHRHWQGEDISYQSSGTTEMAWKWKKEMARTKKKFFPLGGGVPNTIGVISCTRVYIHAQYVNRTHGGGVSLLLLH